MKGEKIMKKLIILVSLILIFVVSCSPEEVSPAPDNMIIEDIDENLPSDNEIESGEDDLIDGEVVLDLDKPFVPLNYQLQEAFPSLQFEQPLLLTNANDGSNTVFVVEKTGKIRYFNNNPNIEAAQIFLDLSSKIDSGASEKGLLGLAFHPEYQDNGYFYVNYTDRNNTVVARYSRLEDSNTGDINSEEILLTIEQPYSNHNGGHLEFGPDGYLHIGTGDGGSGGDPQNNSQNKTNLLGKILRIDVDIPSEDMSYGIPDDNPFKGNIEGYREEIFAYGLRNPWKFSFDRARDILIAADVGQDKMEEINIIKNGGNYGWNLVEGTLTFKSNDNISDELIPPIWEYEHPIGKSITGGYTYYGEDNPSLYGIYIYGDFISGKIWGLWMDRDNGVQNHEILSSDIMISSFGLDEKGEIYVIDYNGKIYKIKEI